MQHRLLAVVGAVALITVGCDEGVRDIETGPAAAEIRSLLESNGAGTELIDCPVDDFETLLTDSFTLLDDQVVRTSLSGLPRATTFETFSTPPTAVLCELVDESGSIAGFYLLDAPADIAAFSNEVNASSISGVTIDIDESRLFGGGRFHHVCTTNDDRPELDICEVDWLDDNLMVAVFALGEGASEIGLDDLEERFGYILPIIVERLTDE